ncbi:hypothetical protein [Sphingomonas sp. Leaf34]|jgi:hypothetical protein|uniref:hypothetical protein n=1 Tax=Sphingomonas sp. Leaf34 TaxID=1736216 RepID=UPI000A623BC0|nr:hypothetical protein [Sphingomonas sp. Leaf34]
MRKPRIAMRPVPAHIVSQMLADMRDETGSALMMRYGISYNTWRKLRVGDPVRDSLAERLERRVVELQAADPRSYR